MSLASVYLIAHNVRGEARFDIAVKLDLDTPEDPWYILQTGGWRVYPFWVSEFIGPDDILSQMPKDAQDCFKPSDFKPKGRNLIEELGLIKREPVRRI